MDKSVFARRLLEAAVAARDFARQFILEALPDPMVFRVRLNSSYDGNPLHEDEAVFPEDGSPERAAAVSQVPAEDVVELLWRDGRVPEWIDLNVIGETGTATIIQVLACGRFTANERLLYHSHEGRPPFHSLGPVLPVGYEEGQRFSVHHRSECWSRSELEHAEKYSSQVWSLELCSQWLDDTELFRLPSFPGLEILELNGVRVEGQGLRSLARLPRLRVLRVSFAGTKAFSLETMPLAPQLTTLWLDHLPPHVSGLAGLHAKTPALEELQISAKQQPVFDGPVARLERLRRLAVSLPHLAPGLTGGSVDLEKISLRLTETSDEAIAALVTSFPSLETVSLEGTPVSDAILTDALRWQELRSLNVLDTKVTKDGLAAFQTARPKVRTMPRFLK